jgi:hypothetical protein
MNSIKGATIKIIYLFLCKIKKMKDLVPSLVCHLILTNTDKISMEGQIFFFFFRLIKSLLSKRKHCFHL